MTYDGDTVELLLPGVCWTHHIHTIRTEYGRKNHTCIRNETMWTNPPQAERKSTIDPANYRMLGDISKSRKEAGCDPDKRKTTINPKHSNKVWAQLIDVQRAWDDAGLTDKERAVLFLRYSDAKFDVADIALNQGNDKSVVSRRLANAVNKMTNWLNGDATDGEIEND